MAEDSGHGEGIGEEGEDPHLGAAVGAAEGEDLLDPSDQARPAGAGGALRGRQGLRVGGSRVPWSVRRVAGESRDAFAQGGMGSQHAVVAVPVDTWRGDQPGQGGEELDRREDEERAPVGGGARRLVEDVPNLSGSRGSIVR